MTDTQSELLPDASLEETLAHYGVKGMRWGHRKRRDGGGSDGGPPEDVVIKNKPGHKVETSGGRNLPASEDAKKAAAYRQKAKSSTIDSLSNAEMRALIERMRLENDLNKIVAERAPQKGKGQQFIASLTQKEMKAFMEGKKGPVTGLIDTASSMYTLSKGGTPGYKGRRRAS